MNQIKNKDEKIKKY